MKNLSLVFALSLFSNVLFGHGNYSLNNYNSDLNVKMWDNSSFIITVNNSPARKTRNFNLKNIQPGNHYVKIVKRSKNHHYGRKNSRQYGGFVETIFQGNIRVPAKKNVFVSVEGKNCLNFKFFKKNNHHNNGNGSHNNNSRGYNNYYGQGVQNVNVGCQSSNFKGGNYGNAQYGNAQYGRGSYGPVVMSSNSFNRLMNILREEHFDSDRLGVAKQALASNNMNVNQVSAIVEQFTFDSSRLDFAKSAYNKTVDRENYFVINGKFDFSSSVSELNNYIRHNS